MKFKLGSLEVELNDEELKEGYALAANTGVGSITVGRLLVALGNRIDMLQKIVGLGQGEGYLAEKAKEHVEQARQKFTQVEVRS